jgi:hypothetical protein
MGQLPAPDQERKLGSANVTAVVHVQHVHDLAWLLDSISGPLFSPARPPLALKRLSKWGSYSKWILRESAEDGLDANSGGCLRKAPCELSGQAVRARQPRRSPHRLWASSLEEGADLLLVQDVPLEDVLFRRSDSLLRVRVGQ